MAEWFDIIYRAARILLPELLLSLGLWKLSGKLQWRKRWLAWVPGFRYAEFGRSLEMDREGALCGLLDILAFFDKGLNFVPINDDAPVILLLVMLVLFLIQFAYELRLFLRLLTLFGLRKRWVWLWLLADWLTLLILGLGERYQPLENVQFSEDWVAGTTPAALSGVSPAAHKTSSPDTGLSIDLQERTVRDFGKKRYLLKDISLDIPNGSLVLLLGGSGSGKTTFVNAVIGYEKADAKVLLNGSDIYKNYDRMKYRIGFVPQQNLLRGKDTVSHTVLDSAQLRMPAALSAKRRDNKVTEVLDLLGLSAGRDGLVSRKSGGQLRRISIAMELVTDPELFVLDEPDSGLDGVIAREIFTKLRGIADSGKIVIVITHTPDRVIDLFDKVIVLARDSGRVGRLAFYGSPQEARTFFETDTMEGIVMRVNRKEEGGDGMADEYIARYARLAAEEGVEHA